MKRQNRKSNYEKTHLEIHLNLKLISTLALMLVSLILTSSAILATPKLSISNNIFAPEEKITIYITDSEGNENIIISTGDRIFRYSGEISNTLEFYAKDSGYYAVRIFDSGESILYDEKNFTVDRNYFPTNSSILSMDRPIYYLGETVTINIGAVPDRRDLELRILSEHESLRYLEGIEDTVNLSPSKTGNYTIQLRTNFIPVAELKFSVLQSIQSLDFKNGQNNQSENENSASPEYSFNTTSHTNISNMTYYTPEAVVNNEIINNSQIEPQQISNNALDAQFQDFEFVESENSTLTEQENQSQINLPFRFELSDKRGTRQIAKISIANRKINGDYDLELEPSKSGIKKIRINNMRAPPLGQPSTLDLDNVNLKKEEFSKGLGNRNAVKSFFIDPSAINFTNGTIEVTAYGNELWKCKEWNKTLEICDGTWIKVQNIIPGKDYSIEISPADPAFTETGVATINTLKPIYHTNETAQFLIAALNTKGMLTSNANIFLSITSPSNTTYTITSASGNIRETTQGIYVANFTNTNLEGTYTIFIQMTGLLLNATMLTTFEVKNFYEFDIIRGAPASIDPWQGPFSADVEITPYVNTSSYSFTEVIPIDVQIENNGGADITTSGNYTLMTWSGLTGQSSVFYSLQTPLITPNLILLGKSFITYTDIITKVFYEAREWLLAIDPLFLGMFEDAESGWGCTTTGAPVLGNDCGDTPWGFFNYCDDNSGDYLFCTSDDGQEGNHISYAIQMVDWDTFDSNRGIWFAFNPLPYDDVIVSGYQASASLDNNNEFCRIWARDSNSVATIYQCVNNNPTGCEAGDTTPEAADYIFFTANLTDLAGINLSETNISVHIGQQASGTNDYCFWDRINITYLANPPEVLSLSNPSNGATTNNSIVELNFTVNATKDTILPNCTLYLNISGPLEQNLTIYNVTRNTVTNFTLDLQDGNYTWNVECTTLAGLTDRFDSNSTFTVNANPPLKTLVSIDSDTSAPWSTENRNPQFNISINELGSCRLSATDESYSNMANDYNCTPTTAHSLNCTYSGTQLAVGANNLYVACTDTTGQADNTTSNLEVTFTVLCDSHADCASGQYCDTTQQCATDILPGYNCLGIAYSGLSNDNVCGDGSSAFCVNDSSYSFTGWYCTDSATDCVYNNNGNSYDLGYELCEFNSNDYRTCGASNQWDSLVDCADQYDPANQTTITHAGQYCGFYASAQSCTNSSSGGCGGDPTYCGPHYYNQTSQACGSNLNHCDVGCGATCDVSNSTTAEIISGTCYYDRTCSNACAWSQSNENAPTYCINDNDGGACALSSRTDPTTDDTCYWDATCANSVGAGLSSGTSNNLRQDYCDYCNSTGNQSGQYAPSPNATCTSDCPNNGTIYYDSLATPSDRTNDCSAGISTILSDSLNPGDVWNGSAPAYCEDTECDLDCGSLVGSCNLGVCECVDEDNPAVILINPQDNAWSNQNTIDFIYNVSDVSSEIANCSIILNNTIIAINNTINKSQAEQMFSIPVTTGYYNWTVNCIDNSSQSNENTTTPFMLGIDTIQPSITSAEINGTSFSVGKSICINATASDIISGINQVYAQVIRPDGQTENVVLSDTQTTSCDSANSNGIYSTHYVLQYSGTYNLSISFAEDLAGNTNNITTSYLWNVSQGSNLSSTISSPAINIGINESTSNYFYTQTCNAQCNIGSSSCNNVILQSQIYMNGIWREMSLSTPLVPNIQNISCGNMSSQNSPPWWDMNWDKRKLIEITNTNSSTQLNQDYSIRITIDTTTSFLTNGSDLRIIYWNGTDNIEIDRYNTTSFNSATTEIWFKTQGNISPGAKNYSYYIYYDNPSAGPALQDPNNVFKYFNPGNNTDNWASYGTGVSITHNSAGGYLNYTSNANNYNTAGVYYNALNISDLEYSIEFFIQSNDYVMMYARGTTSNTYVSQFLDINDATLTANHIRRNNGGGTTNLVENDIITNDILINTWHNYTMRWVGSRIDSYVDGILESTATNNNVTSGFIGLHNQQGTFRVRNIRVRDLITPEPTASLGLAESHPLNSSSCQYNFTITSTEDSGNGIYPIRCTAESSNSQLGNSTEFSITVNDRPNATLNPTLNNSWINSIYNISAALSSDSDGTIINYLYEIDNNTQFSSPATICSTSQSNCSFDTLLQTQCENNSMGCYIRLNVTDNDGLYHTTYLVFGIDSEKPTTTLDLPRDFENITTNTFRVNATSYDNQVNIHTVFFDYRTNSTNAWNPICTLESAPYNCTWDLTALPDGNDYQVRAYANDTLGNLEQTDNNTNITVDREGPGIYLEFPDNDTFLNGTTQLFIFNTTDITSSVANCTLIINGNLDQTNFSIPEATTLTFSTNLAEGRYSWQITCVDVHANSNSSELRNLTIDNTGPVSVLDLIRQYSNVTGVSALLNASVNDAGIGTLGNVSFDYRFNSTESWQFACADEDGIAPHACNMSLIGLTDGNNYEIRVYANDSLGNNGSYDSHTNITIDNNAPVVEIVSPANGTIDGDGTIIFDYKITSEITSVLNCSLYWQDTINQTTNGPFVLDQEYEFSLNNLTNGNYSWRIDCADTFGYIGTTGRYNITINILRIMKLNVTTPDTVYYYGNQIAETIFATTNITDLYNQSLSSVDTTTDLIRIFNTSEEVPGWWNISWKMRMPIYLSTNSPNGVTNQRIIVNITGLSGNISNCSNEIRVADIFNNLVPADILSGDNSNYCEIAFIGNISANATREMIYLAYYNNSLSTTANSAGTTGTDYQLFFENFDIGGFNNITNEDPTIGCAGGFGRFSNCSDNGDDYDFAATTLGVEISPDRKIVFEDVDTWVATAGLWEEINALIECGGDSCDDIRVSGYVASASLDGVGDYCMAWARNTSSSASTTIYQCTGPDPTCEFTDSDNTGPASTASYEFFNQNLSADLGLGLSNYIAVHIGGDVGGTDEHCFFEDINITGLRKQAPNVTLAETGWSQVWINRTTNVTSNDGLAGSIHETMNKTIGNYSISSLGTKTNYTETYNFTIITITTEIQSPIVSLNSPPNGSEANSSVTFTYFPDDNMSTILNCSLLIDNQIQDTDSVIEEGQVNFFFPRIPLGGWHNWSVNCTDFYGNEGASQAWEIFIRPPDLYVPSLEIMFNTSSPKEGDSIRFSSTIYNIGGSDALNAVIAFYFEDPASGGIQLVNYTVNLTDVGGTLNNITLNATYNITSSGPYNFFVVADPPAYPLNGSLFETNETNNIGNNTVHTPGYHIFYGQTTANIILGESENLTLYIYSNLTNTTGNIYAASNNQTINFVMLQALGRNTANTTTFNDFSEADAKLNMTIYNDSISRTYATESGLPLTTSNFTILGKTIQNVPVTNSTNTTNFITGLMWDTSDGGTEYDGTQDIVVVGKINYAKQGAYGTYDYEIKVPTNLQNYNGGDIINFYSEITN